MNKLKHLAASLLMTLLPLAMNGQLPQFSPDNFMDWEYNNPAIELNQDNILANRIVLYTSSEGFVLTLTSPRFLCKAGQVIDMDVTWVTRYCQSPDFVTHKAGFTVALINAQGAAVDSVTFTPTQQLNRENQVHLTMAVARTLSNARLRFASWKGDVVSSGAVRSIVMSASYPADVNLDGEVTLADVNAIIGIIAGGSGDHDLAIRADVNRDNEVSLADINAVIDVILS